MYRFFKNFACVCDDYLDNLHVVSIKSLDNCVFLFFNAKMFNVHNFTRSCAQKVPSVCAI